MGFELKCRRSLTNCAPAETIEKLHPLQHVGLWRSLGARFHGMEEVVGSIPTRSTNQITNLLTPFFADERPLVSPSR